MSKPFSIWADGRVPRFWSALKRNVLKCPEHRDAWRHLSCWTGHHSRLGRTESRSSKKCRCILRHSCPQMPGRRARDAAAGPGGFGSFCCRRLWETEKLHVRLSVNWSAPSHAWSTRCGWICAMQGFRLSSQRQVQGASYEVRHVLKVGRLAVRGSAMWMRPSTGILEDRFQGRKLVSKKPIDV